MKRLQSSGIKRVVIGISGGLDSTHALIVAAKTIDRLKLPRENILGYTMPGFATSHKTLENAHALMKALRINGEEIDIRPSCIQMLKDLRHPFGAGEPVYDVTFENVQAGERTSHLFRLANHHGALVLGTGDLSELALGWCTYGVGDHMSHYNVNASVPKTLIQHLIGWVIASSEFGKQTGVVLQSILETEISPELVPHQTNDRSAPAQSTEAKVGPYDLQDFNLYYITRYGFRPSKVAFLCQHAWSDKLRGTWPDYLAPEKHREYDLPTIKKWLEVFVYRFFQLSQFKRSCLPNGPKVGSGGSLSPRGDWRAPSDAEAAAWLEETRTQIP
jgi:NAD+ synthase (glutamine-hydrolysing)